MRDIESGVICRWIHRKSRILFDLMPVDSHVLGFSNRWYRYAVDTARPINFGDGLTILMVTAPAFIATKLEAFADRGAGDILTSHDLEDILNVVDGREELTQEMETAPASVRDAVRTTLRQLLAHDDFSNALPGLIADADRTNVVLERRRRLAS